METDRNRDDDTTPIAVTRKGHLPFTQLSVAVLRNPALSAQAKALYGVIASYADLDDRTAFPSRATLAADLGLGTATSVDGGRRSISRWVSELERAGVLRVEYRSRKDGSRSSNLYVLLDADDVRPRTKTSTDWTAFADPWR
jgi:hypothetical protein